MLQNMRDRMTGPMAIGIVLLISVPFAFWGIDSYMHQGGGGDVADVGDVSISQQQLQNAYNQSLSRLQSMLGDQFKPGMIDTPRFKRGVLENLIQQQLVLQQVVNLNYQVSDGLLRSVIAAEPAFQEDGKFSASRYQQVLAASGMRPEVYEAQLRRDLLSNQLQGSMRVSAFVTRAQLQARWQLQHQQRHLGWLVITPQSAGSEVKITDAQVAARYAQDKASFHTPERIKLTYVKLDRNALKPAAKPSDDVLKVIYESEKNSRFVRPGQRRARHILIKVAPGTTDPKAKKTIDMLVEKLAKGADFAKLAKEYSQDSGSSDKGGELGWVSRGVMVPAFEKALFAMQNKGAVSGPVRTDYGWHLIQLEDIRPKQIKPFDSPEVQAVLLQQYNSRELNERYQQMSKNLDKYSFDYPKSLKKVQEKLGLEIHTSEWFTREQGNGIASSDAIREAAFSDVVLKNRENSLPIKLPSGVQLVIRVAAYEPERQKPLKEVAEQIRQQLRVEAQAELAAQQAEALLAQVQKNPDQAAQLAVQGNSRWHAYRWLERSDAADKVAQPIIDAGFALAHPDKGETLASIAVLDDGTRAVVLLDQVRVNPPDDKDKKVMAKLRAQTIALESARETAAYMQYLREQIGVKINSKALD